ncbi:MAG: hypothetical protein CMF38_07630 [Legionellaceae bacterium]|nr:hypothetical protein [Legionellaceae bacterium]MBJ16483.1 hypothetical protein [Legionellaceae bacterium]HCA89766.1 hypothetical protein [Legionellales bacterium]|tara:strand:- start:553 stop:1470 length:918 start_codon:yes stop_codon:yes gene_type:complete
MPDLNPAPPNFNQQLEKLLATSIDNECSENYSSQIKALIEKEPDFFLSEEKFKTAQTIFDNFLRYYSSDNTQNDNILKKIRSALFLLRSSLSTDFNKILKNQSLESPEHRADIAQMNLAEIEKALNLLLPTEYEAIKDIIPSVHRHYFQKKRQWNAAQFLSYAVAFSLSALLISVLIPVILSMASASLAMGIGIPIALAAVAGGFAMLMIGFKIADVIHDKKQEKLAEYKSTHPLVVDEKNNVLSAKTLKNVNAHSTNRLSCHFGYYPDTLKDKQAVNQAVHGFFKERYDARGALNTDTSSYELN